MVFSTDQGRFGKYSDDVREGDNIWNSEGSVIASVLRPLAGSGVQEDAARDRYILVGAYKVFGGVENTWDLPERAKRMIEIV